MSASGIGPVALLGGGLLLPACFGWLAVGGTPGPAAIECAAAADGSCDAARDALEVVRGNIGGWCGTPDMGAWMRLMALDPAPTELAQALGDRDIEVARFAARALVEHGRGEEVLAWCREHAGHTNADVFCAAAGERSDELAGLSLEGSWLAEQRLDRGSEPVQSSLHLAPAHDARHDGSLCIGGQCRVVTAELVGSRLRVRGDNVRLQLGVHGGRGLWISGALRPERFAPTVQLTHATLVWDGAHVGPLEPTTPFELAHVATLFAPQYRVVGRWSAQGELMAISVLTDDEHLMTIHPDETGGIGRVDIIGRAMASFGRPGVGTSLGWWIRSGEWRASCSRRDDVVRCVPADTPDVAWVVPLEDEKTKGWDALGGVERHALLDRHAVARIAWQPARGAAGLRASRSPRSSRGR